MCASKRRVTLGRLSGLTIMSPRLMSISSSSRMVTDWPAKASSISPSQVSIALTFDALPRRKSDDFIALR